MSTERRTLYHDIIQERFESGRIKAIALKPKHKPFYPLISFSGIFPDGTMNLEGVGDRPMTELNGYEYDEPPAPPPIYRKDLYSFVNSALSEGMISGSYAAKARRILSRCSAEIDSDFDDCYLRDMLYDSVLPEKLDATTRDLTILLNKYRDSESVTELREF